MEEPHFSEEELKLFRILVDNLVQCSVPDEEETELLEKLYRWIVYKEKF